MTDFPLHKKLISLGILFATRLNNVARLLSAGLAAAAKGVKLDKTTGGHVHASKYGVIARKPSPDFVRPTRLADRPRKVPFREIIAKVSDEQRAQEAVRAAAEKEVGQ